jgi:tetratricopeptide (TPR) repeat protein
MLNESVSSANCDKLKEFKINQVSSISIPENNPWFENWRETFLSVQFPSDHEFTRHFLSCLIVLSSAEQNAVDVANQLTKKVQMLQNITPPKLPKWFSSDTLNCYVMLHDASTGDLSKAQQGFENLKSSFGENRCFLIQINSRKDGKTEFVPDLWLPYLKKVHKQEAAGGLETTVVDSAPRTPQDINITQMPSSVQMSQLETPPSGIITNASEVAHPLSPMQEQVPEITVQQPTLTMSTSTDSLTLQGPLNPNVWQNEVDQIDLPHGQCLTPPDIDNLKHFVQDFTVRALVPYVEKMVQILNDSITNKKSVSKSLIGATKRWFVTNKTQTQNAVIYNADSSELQTRKLGDLYFMFGNYNLAFQAYHQAKRDFNADSAWQYYAGALEMAAIAAFMQGTANRKTFDYMEEAISTYLTVCKLPQFATRATLLSVECLKSAGLYSEAAKQLTRMTSEDSDLRSALLLEQAAYCFLMSQPPFYRKYAFHSVLSGHRYSKAQQRKHAFRLYKQAEQIFSSKGWNLAEDHIQYTISKQAITLKKLEEATTCLSHLLRPSSLQSSQQQSGFLREYLATQKTLLGQLNGDELLNISLPKIMQNAVRVLVTSPASDPKDSGFSPATNIDIQNSFDDEWQWHKMEEMVVQSGSKKPVMVFKASRSLYTGENPTTEHPLCVFGEPIEISFVLENPIKPSILFEDVCLLWEFKKESGEMFSNRNFLRNGGEIFII